MQIVTPSVGTILEGDAALDALKVSARPAEADGYYFFSGRTGLVAAPAANSVLWYFIFHHMTKICVVDYLRVRAIMTTPPTTAQEWGLEAILARRATAATSSGTTFTSTQAGGFRKRSTYPPSAIIPVTSGTFSMAIATTTALTATGAGTADVSEFISDMTWELAAAAAVPRSRVEFQKDYTVGSDSPIILAGGDPFDAVHVRVNPNAIGAAGVMRASVEFAWHEVDPGKL